jgi:flagellar protein FliO/FliZ
MTFSSLLSAVAALAVVLSAIVLVGRLARLPRFAHRIGRETGRMRIVEQLNLDPRRRLLLVRCDSRCVLLLTGQQDQVVGWLPEQTT